MTNPLVVVGAAVVGTAVWTLMLTAVATELMLRETYTGESVIG